MLSETQRECLIVHNIGAGTRVEDGFAQLDNQRSLPVFQMTLECEDLPSLFYSETST
jgi:hypothetical protein